MKPQSATLEILGRLVAFPTVSADSNLALIGYAEDLLRNAGFETLRMPTRPGRRPGWSRGSVLPGLAV